MVVSPGIGKAATAVADKATTTTAKGASKEQVGRFDSAMAKPDQGGAGAASTASSANQAGAAGNAAAAAGSPPPTGVEAARTAQGGAPSGGPGDKILKGIDGMRSTARNLVNGAPSTPGAEGANPAGSIGDLIDTQKSMIGFEVTTQVGGKGVQETNQAVQTLLKGQ